jgi:hypothetical protein
LLSGCQNVLSLIIQRLDFGVTSNQFWEELFETVLLLAGLFIFNVVLSPFMPAILMAIDDRLVRHSLYSYWVGQIVFGIVTYLKLRRFRNAISIGLLSATVPVFGALFYLLTVSFKSKIDD